MLGSTGRHMVRRMRQASGAVMSELILTLVIAGPWLLGVILYAAHEGSK